MAVQNINLSTALTGDTQNVLHNSLLLRYWLASHVIRHPLRACVIIIAIEIMAAKIKLMLFSLCTYSEILSSDSKNYDSTSSSVTIFNAYISREISAKINFGIEPREMIGQIDYGKHKKVFLNTKNRDYIIQFIRPPKGGKSFVVR